MKPYVLWITKKAGFITDDVLRELLVDPIEKVKNVKLTCLLDCCHSGTLLDMRYNYKVSHRPMTSSYNIVKDKHYKKTNNKIVVFSGCMDKQYSADAWIDKKAQGAMTWGFIKIINQYKKKNLTYKKFISSLQALLKKNGYDQIPQLSSGNFLELKETFCV